jgi:hypothetical protein
MSRALTAKRALPKETQVMFPATAQRVRVHTADDVNERIRQQTEASVARHAAGGPDAIARRLAELDREWDIERYVETMAPSFTLTGLFLGVTVSRKWLLLPAVIQTFFLQHALQGWCPPIPVLRRLGVRTIQEIDHERYALKALRGDFRQEYSGENGRSAHAAMEAARR